jgi:hypothetical protein
LQHQIDQSNREIADLNAELDHAQQQREALEQLTMPDFEAQLLEKYAAELEAPAKEEVYEPEEEAGPGGARVVHEEEIGEEALGGDEELVTEYEEMYEDDAEEQFFTSAGATLMNPCLIERRPNGKAHIYDLVPSGDKTFIGSREECAVCLPNPGVDPKHAWIRVDRHNQYLLKDLGSRSGVFVNGQRVKKTVLKNGDVLKIGSVELTLKLV